MRLSNFFVMTLIFFASSLVFAGGNDRPVLLSDGSKLTDCVYKEGSPFLVEIEQASCSTTPFRMCVGSIKCIAEEPNGDRFWYNGSAACKVVGDSCPSAADCYRKDAGLKEGESMRVIHEPKVKTSALFERHSAIEGLAHDDKSPFAFPLPIQ